MAGSLGRWVLLWTLLRGCRRWNKCELSVREGDGAALAASIFGVLPTPVLGRLADETGVAEVAAGRLLFDYELSVVASGHFRAFISASVGRQLTVAYLSAPVVLGLAHVAGRRYPTAFQCLKPARLLRVGDGRFKELVSEHPKLGWAATQEVSGWLDGMEAELARVTFGTLRHRVAFHLLTLTADGGGRVHQAELASAVGSVREVISRTVTQMRLEGLVEVGPGGVAVADRERLSALTDP